MEEQEKVMSLTLKDLSLGGDPIKIKLDCAEAVKTGEGNYGNWYLWFGYVENAPTVYDKNDKGKYNVPVNNYTGKVSFFPTEKLNNELVTLANGNVNVEVSIKKTAEEGRKGLITRYIPEKLSEGKSLPNSLTTTENKLVNDVKALKTAGIPVSFDIFLEASQAETYEGKISKDRAKTLWSFVK